MINAEYTKILIKASSRNAIRKKIWKKQGGCCYFLFETKIVNVLSNVTYSASHRQAGDPTNKYPVSTLQRSRFV